MVEQNALDMIFKSLSDPTRRDILTRVREREMTIGELAHKYHMSFAATAKHISILERANLVSKRKQGKQQIITINGASFEQANEYLQEYAMLWNDRFDRMEKVLMKQGK